ncbi:hypothetical protein Goari_016979 [Gossypium aridum]|uniref:Uncharacterized protein n=1 Tax=Gossypium aridum TaxID=34290 RepID=A0A7J8WL83_GOSAI|nr:hypothetical protein [Gossypium aridum]
MEEAICWFFPCQRHCPREDRY